MSDRGQCGTSAAEWILTRMQEDPRLAWLLGAGSESFDRLTAEYAKEKGIDPKGYRKEFLDALKTQELPPIGIEFDGDKFFDPDEISNRRLSFDLQSEAAAEGSVLASYAALERVWLDMRGKDCPQSLRDLIWDTIGKVL